MATKTQSAWKKRPRILQHTCLGKTQRWDHSSRRIRIERFPESTGRYIALFADQQQGGLFCYVSDHRALKAAQRSCEKHLRSMLRQEAKEALALRRRDHLDGASAKRKRA